MTQRRGFDQSSIFDFIESIDKSGALLLDEVFHTTKPHHITQLAAAEGVTVTLAQTVVDIAIQRTTYIAYDRFEKHAENVENYF